MIMVGDDRKVQSNACVSRMSSAQRLWSQSNQHEPITLTLRLELRLSRAKLLRFGEVTDSV